RREDGRQRRDRTVHQARQPRLHDLQDEEPPLGLVLFLPDLRLELSFLQLGSALDVGSLFRRQIVQQLAYAGVLCACRGLLIEAPRLHFHGADLAADLLQAKRRVQPDRLALYKSAHVLAADEWDVLAELLLVQLDQPAAMPDLLLAHFFKHLSCAGKVFPHALAKVGINAFILFLQRNRQGKNFLLGQAIEVFHCHCLLLRGYCFADRGTSRFQRDSSRSSVREELLLVLFRYLLPTLSLPGREPCSRRSRSSRRQRDRLLPGLSA